jgi:glycosyltransferase involved in cell wall biosynthesis
MVVAHDAERSLGLALASVLSQTIDDWECIVVDDGSARPVGALIESFRDPRFRYVRLNENRGRGYARQAGLDAAQGRLLAILDADDWMYPSRLEAELSSLEREPRTKIVGCSMVVEDATHRVLGVQQAGVPGPRRLGGFRSPLPRFWPEWQLPEQSDSTRVWPGRKTCSF